jgi:hypothetical protein
MQFDRLFRGNDSPLPSLIALTHRIPQNDKEIVLARMLYKTDEATQ